MAGEFSFSIKRKDNKAWLVVDLIEMSGVKLQDAMEAMDGDEYVAEFIFPNGKVYFCGTEALRDAFKSRGDKAMTFGEGIKQLIAKGRRDILSMTCPETIIPYLDIFGGEVEVLGKTVDTVHSK